MKNSSPLPASSPEESHDGIEWSRLLAAVRRRKLLILLVTVVGSAAGVVLGKLVDPTYVVEARIWIDNPSRRGPDLGPIQTSQLLETNAWEELLRSYRVLDEVVRGLGLYLAPEPDVDPDLFRDFDIDGPIRPGNYVLRVSPGGERVVLASKKEDQGVLEEGEPGDSIGSELGFAWAPSPEVLRPGLEVEFTVQTVRDVSRSLAQRIESRMDQKGNFLRVNLRGTEPDLLAATLNAVVNRFVTVAGELKRATLSEKTVILEEQLREAERQLNAADSALEAFGVQTIALPSEGESSSGRGGPVMENFFELQLEREELRRNRQAIQRALDEAGSGAFPVETLVGIPLVEDSGELTRLMDEVSAKRAELRSMRFRYTEDSPQVTRLRNEIEVLETEALPNEVRELVDEIRKREAALEEEIREKERSLEDIPPRALEEARLRRNVELTRELYTTLQQRYEEARLAEVSSIPDLRILDSAAAPRVPESEPGPQIMLMGFMGSLGMALGGAILLDRTDHRIRYPSQITQRMGLNILGAVPRLSKGKSNGRRDESEAEVLEAFRSLRLNLAHSYGSAGPMILTITSSGVGDGKSFIAANLADVFARNGQSTVLIDGDTRRGTQHELLGVDRKPGLTDYLEGTIPIEQLVRTAHDRKLGFVPGGTRREASPERLSSRRMRTLLAHLKSKYRVILIDTPPVRAGVDALALASLTGNLLFVLRAGETDLTVAESNLALLDPLPVRVLGAVLNAVPPGGEIYRHYSYLPAYEIVPEESETQPKGLPRPAVIKGS